jgi:hypothetical protein
MDKLTGEKMLVFYSLLATINACLCDRLLLWTCEERFLYYGLLFDGRDGGSHVNNSA